MKFGMMLAALAMAGLSGSAQATVQTYDFTAVLETIGSFNELSWSDSGEGVVSGTRVSKGDLIRGRVSFNDAMPYAPLIPPWVQPPVPLPSPTSNAPGEFYYGGTAQYVVSLNYTILGIDQRYSSAQGGVTVDNNYDNGDSFGVQTYSGQDGVGSAGISLINADGSLFNNGTIPKALSLNDFNRTLFNATWYRGSDSGLILAHAVLTELTLVNEVPEPATGVMVLSGLALAGLAARRRRNANAAPAA